MPMTRSNSSRVGVDLALLDFNMPGMDGLQLAAELRSLKPGRCRSP